MTILQAEADLMDEAVLLIRLTIDAAVWRSEPA